MNENKNVKEENVNTESPHEKKEAQHPDTKKQELLYDAVTEIRDDLIEGAETHTFTGKKKTVRLPLWIGSMAALFAVILMGRLFFRPETTEPISADAHAITTAHYPEMSQYPDESAYIDPVTGELDDEAFFLEYDAWREDKIRQTDQPSGYADGLEDFYRTTLRQFLSGAGDKNVVYSPLNVYMALGMLAELTGQDSRQQILDLLGCDDIEALRAQASALWNANYSKDGAVNSILASSLWLNEDIRFVQPTLDRLSETYYASSYQGRMGSPALNNMLQDWLNEQTGGMLKEQIQQIGLDSDTILALAATIYFQARWASEFSAQDTAQGTFHAADSDISCDFMHQSEPKTYYWGDKFSAVAQSLLHSGAMWFILPDEGTAMDDLLQDKELTDFITDCHEWENRQDLLVNLSIPKFDVVSQLDLKDGLQRSGITDVFDPDNSDFSPMTTEQAGISVSKVQHDVRVSIDEEGCSAAAYTVMPMDGGGMISEDEIDFTLDRPFLFMITGETGQPLFVGIVNLPS